jgi:hypothetical protein
MHHENPPLTGHARKRGFAVRTRSQQQFELFEMLRFLFLMTTQELQHRGRNVLSLR